MNLKTVVPNLRAALQARKGEWAAIGRKYQVPYDTLQKFADGRVQTPALDTLNKLLPLLRKRKVSPGDAARVSRVGPGV